MGCCIFMMATQEAWFDNDQKVRHRCGLSTTKCVSPAPSSNLAGWTCHLPIVLILRRCSEPWSGDTGYSMKSVWNIPSPSWNESTVTSGQRGRYAFLSVTMFFLLNVCIERYRVTLVFFKAWSKLFPLQLLGIPYIYLHMRFMSFLISWTPVILRSILWVSTISHPSRAILLLLEWFSQITT